MRVTRGAAVAAVACLALAGCGNAEVAGSDEGPVVHAQYGLHYTVGADQYDAAKATRGLRECLRLPGASDAGSDDSLPPGPSVAFDGTQTQETRLRKCLDDLPDSEVRGPFPRPSTLG